MSTDQNTEATKIAAWNDPAEFQRQQVIYSKQLVREGFEPGDLSHA